MKVKLIGGGPMTGRVMQVPDDIFPEVFVAEPVERPWLPTTSDIPTAPSHRIGRYSSLQPGINGGPKRLVWQGYS
jgi:hypothetical protein